MNVEHRTDDTGSLLQGLVAKDEIRELVVRYGLGVDGKDPVVLKSIFTDDIKFHAANGDFEFQGVDALVDFFLNQVAEATRNSLHVTHGHIVDLDPNHPDLASGVLFGLFHISDPITLVPLTLMGVCLGWLYIRSRSLWSCWAMHVGNNAVSLGFVVLAE